MCLLKVVENVIVVRLFVFFFHNCFISCFAYNNTQKFRHVLYGPKSNKFNSNRSVESDYDENTDDDDSDSDDDDDWQNSVATTDIDTDGSDEEYDAEVFNIAFLYTMGMYLNYT